MVMAKASLMGNCFLSKWNPITSSGNLNFMLGMKAPLPAVGPTVGEGGMGLSQVLQGSFSLHFPAGLKLLNVQDSASSTLSKLLDEHLDPQKLGPGPFHRSRTLVKSRLIVLPKRG